MEKSNITNIKNLWEKIIETSSYLKFKYGSNFDGLKYWNLFKTNLNNVDLKKEIKWNKRHDEIRESLINVIDSLPEKDIDDKLIEHNHFFLQILNIPKKDPNVSFRRLMQIALNIGQLNPYLDDKLFKFNINEIYNENKLNEINTFISDENLKEYNFSEDEFLEILEILNQARINVPLKNQTGGNKYKIKYFDL